jgi:hypothetical protein
MARKPAEFIRAKAQKANHRKSQVKMARKPAEFIRGLAVFIVLWVLILGVVQIRLGIPDTVIAWLSRSPNPMQALVAFSALLSSIIVGAVRLGIEFGPLKDFVSSKQLRTYLTGLPLWMIGIVFALALAFLVLVPTCQPPVSVLFEVNGQETLTPSQTLVAHPNATAILKLKSPTEGEYFYCQWQYAGSAFNSMGASTGACEINVQFANQPGEGFLTVLVRQNLCTQSAVFPLSVKVTTP